MQQVLDWETKHYLKSYELYVKAIIINFPRKFNAMQHQLLKVRKFSLKKKSE